MANYSEIFEIMKKKTTNEGIDLIWSDLIPTFKGVYFGKPVNRPGVPLIILESGLQGNPEEGCLVLAHELGHHILHSKNFDHKLYYSGAQENESYIKLVEAEATAFAKGLIKGVKMGLAKETLLKKPPSNCSLKTAHR